MTRDEIVTALRCCASFDGEYECSTTCAFYNTSDELSDCCTKKNTAAADLIENQQRHIEALMKANDSLKDAIMRRDKHIEILKKQVEIMVREQDAMGKRIAMREEKQWTKTY